MTEILECVALCPPGMEDVLRGEMIALGFSYPRAEVGGVAFKGQWPDIWRANLLIRGASRILVRIAKFRARDFSELEAASRAIDWPDVFLPGTNLSITATCRKSKLYHSGAVEQRVGAAATRALGSSVRREGMAVFVRLDRDMAVISVDTSGELLHRRGYRTAIGPAPLRESLASLYLSAMDVRGETNVIDPMCGSGTFPIEAAQRAMGIVPGVQRGFAFERLATFDAEVWQVRRAKAMIPKKTFEPVIQGSDKSAKAITAATANAERADVADRIDFSARDIADLQPTDIAPGVMMLNPPFGARLGSTQELRSVYRTIGDVARRFAGWRIGLITPDPELAKATGLPFRSPGPAVPHGALRVQLFQTDPLA